MDPSSERNNPGEADERAGSGRPVASPKPLELLDLYTQKYGLARYWRRIEKRRAHRPKLNGWPNWCYYPSRKSYPLMIELDPGVVEAHARISALAAWRATQGIYRYDRILFDELWNTPITGGIPFELLHRLPEWCIYIEVEREAPLPQRHLSSDYLNGVFVYLDFDPRTQEEQVCFALDCRHRFAATALIRAGGLEESIRYTEEHVTQCVLAQGGSVDNIEYDFQRVGRIMEPLLSLTLYLCSNEPDLTDSAGSGRKPTYADVISARWPRGKKWKKSARMPPRLLVADSPTKWNVGYRIGATIRHARNEVSGRDGSPTGTRQSPIPHIRRAHWHTYWVGPRSEPEKRKQVLTWLPPIAVKLDRTDDLISTVRPVKA